MDINTKTIAKALLSITRITVTILLVVFVGWLVISRPALLDYQSSSDGLDLANIKVNSNRLKQHVKTLSVDLVPRSYQDIENLNAAADYIAKALGCDNAGVHYQSYEVAGEQYHNVIAEFGKSSDADNDDVIVIGAHYDVYGNHPGADDNASGVAGLLELARLLCTASLNTSVILVAYTLEEPPMYNSEFMGSVKHAQLLKQQNISVKLMISLETIGFYSERPKSQTYPMLLLKGYYPDQGNFISVVGNMMSNSARQLKIAINQNTELESYSINAPTAITGVDFSDHRSYWSQGFNAVMITDTAFYRNTAYHTNADTFDRLNYAKMADVVLGVYAYVISQ
ncbi:MAG: hypothetical protein ACI8WB_000406 [Phenylobacterium sp.]